MSLFLNYSGGAPDAIHSTDNIIHEFGHLLTLSPPVGRTANSEAIGSAAEMPDRPVALWEQIQIYRAFNETEGWENKEYRQNPTDLPAEVVADMFLYWTQGYPFTQDQHNYGQARSAFVNGGEIPGQDGNPIPRIDGESTLESAGIAGWAGNAACTSTGNTSIHPQPTALENDPYWMAANNGWCSFG